MAIRPSRLALATCSALALLAAPIALNGIPHLAKIDAIAADHGNGGGNGGGNGTGGGNGGGNGNGGGGGNSDGNGSGGDGGSHGQSGDNHGSSTKSQTASLDVEQAGSSGKSSKSSKTLTVASADKTGSLKAKLGGLNSLTRNINGLMNSSDPRMGAIRDFIKANAALATDQAALDQAKLDLITAQGTYDDYVTGLLPTAWDSETGATPYMYTDTSLADLQQHLDSLTTLAGDANTDPADVPLIQAEIDQLSMAIGKIEGSTELDALNTAVAAESDLEQQVASDTTASGDSALTDALIAAANPNRLAQYGDEYVDAAMLDWAKKKLGVGDYNGLIDAYEAKQ